MGLSIVILAAGEGTRMRSTRPKVLQPLAGIPMLAHVLDIARRLGPDQIVVVYGVGGSAVRRAFPAPDLHWVKQEEQRGTAHALAAVLPEVPEDNLILVLYGDVPLLRAATLKPLITAASRGTLALLSARFADPSGYGRILRNEQGEICGVVEDRDAGIAQRRIKEINTGVLAAPALRFAAWLPRIGNNNSQGEYYLTDTVALAIDDGVTVRAIEATDCEETRGVNDRIQLAAAEACLRRRRAEELMLAGVTVVDPMRIDVRGILICGRDVEIDINCIFEGRVELADSVRIGAGVLLRDTVVGAGTEIRPYSLIEGSHVGAGALIGPFARVRPGTEVADDAHIGNFVELKNTRLGPGSKANHLAYLGDARIGAGVNVGAGVITCNYDGVAKYQTEIEDDVFIGSDCPLVAPVKIGAGATIGAGSTVTADVPAGKLVVARSRQTIIEGWERPRKNPPKKE